ncbi:MAG TPA: hypothetical protein VFF27_00095 [Bacteroidia bacterium]|jgi:hypothetical protein|nr:hypothetical protein [Bacteroidia bacterium]
MRTIKVFIKSLNKEGYISWFWEEEIDNKKEYIVRYKPSPTSGYCGNKIKGSDLVKIHGNWELEIQERIRKGLERFMKSKQGQLKIF